ncbi:hypothetical protein [Hyphomonas sp.]|uniref:hypothetical protein n=1 Tax=Hyphomonas sp. TaxID=87 RepID=UPI00235669F8|nr:hypothetical protein [Hyphomonas sp.]
MCRRVAREAFQVIKDHDIFVLALRIEIGKQRHHPRPLQVIPTARDRVREDRFDLIALLRSILTATMLLAIQAVPV